MFHQTKSRYDVSRFVKHFSVAEHTNILRMTHFKDVATPLILICPNSAVHVLNTGRISIVRGRTEESPGAERADQLFPTAFFWTAAV